MKIEKLYMPYLLASQHLVIHAACLITSIWFEWVREINMTDLPEKKRTIGLSFELLNATHGICFLIEVMIRFIEYKQS